MGKRSKQITSSPGFTLLEVLISLWLLSLLLCGLIATEWSVIRKNEATYYQSVAILQASSLEETIKALKILPASQDLAKWNQENQTILPHGKGMIIANGSNFLIKIVWGAIQMNDCVSLQLKTNGGCYLSKINKEYF